jgi:large subunit ribosomal protein L44e
MKIPKKQKHYCPKCKKHTEMAVSEAKKRTRSTSHPMSRGSMMRMRGRGLRRGYGNQNKYSKPAISKFKRTGAKISKKTDLRYKCNICKKIVVQNKGIRMKKVELV